MKQQILGKQAFFSDLPKQITTLGALYTKVFDRFTLGCLIQEALECIRPPVSCKDLLRDLTVDDIKGRISLAFPLLPNTVKQINDIIAEQEKKEAEQLEKQRLAEEQGRKTCFCFS